MTDWDEALTPEERAMGFSVMTRTYGAGGGDLPLLGDSGVIRERAVALMLDDLNRIRRRHDGRGYLHERFDGQAWRMAGEFTDLREVGDSAVWRTHRAAGADGGGAEEET
jgi:hypothetical protein